MAAPTAGALIWISIRPLLKIFACVFAGFMLTRRGLFPPAASKGLAQVAMNLALPCLIFSSIVPSFNSSNIANIGPLLLTAIFYEITGLLMALVVREIFWVPKNFRWGILIMGALSNWGNLPTAVVQSVAAAEPFDPATDPALGVGFVAVFILVYNLSFFTGVYKICAWDFLDLTEEGPPETLIAKWGRRRRWVDAKLGRRGKRNASEAEEGEGGVTLPELQLSGEKIGASEKERADIKSGGLLQIADSTTKQRRVSFGQQQSQVEKMDRLTRQTSAATVEAVETSSASRPGKSSPPPETDYPLPDRRTGPKPSPSSAMTHRLPPPPSSRSPSPAPQPPTATLPPTFPSPALPTAAEKAGPITVFAGMKAAAMSIVSPITISLVLSLIIALISPIKALFVPNVEGWSGTKIQMAPDGRPALAFIQETTVFIGAICVPGALILLGASFARLKIPKKVSELPIGAIIAITITKMVILPVIGVSFVQGLSHTTTLYPKDDKILSFVAMLLSGNPAAVNQLVVTSLVAPEGKTDMIAAFLLCQYLFMFISSTCLTAVSLKFVS